MITLAILYSITVIIIKKVGSRGKTSNSYFGGDHFEPQHD